MLRVERFGKKPGSLALVDLRRTDTQAAGLKAGRLEFREVFRRFLRREFPGYRLAEISTEANLEQSLSPAYPRALLREGRRGLAAIGSGPESNAGGVLTFGLIWLDHLRRTRRDLAVQGLVIFLPAGAEKDTCLRLRFLDPALASYAVFGYTEEGYTRPLDPKDYGNTDTRLEPCRAVAENASDELSERLAGLPGVAAVRCGDGSLSYRVEGLEFARYHDCELTWGLETKRPASPRNWSEMQTLVRELARVRTGGAADQQHPLYLRNPESWLEARLRSHLEEIDPGLHRAPLYGQVPAFAAGGRGVIDLLAIDRAGRLAVIEVKASQDVHLPLQALDYWLRVKWHLDRGEFSGRGYFPGVEVRPETPRLLLVAPALEFHPMNERVLRFFSQEVEVERLGVGWQWRQELKLCTASGGRR